MTMLDKGLPIAPIPIDTFASKTANHAVCLELVRQLMSPALDEQGGWANAPDDALDQLKTTLQQLK